MEGFVKDGAANAEQSAEVERVTAFVMKAIENDVRGIAQLMGGKRDEELFGQTEFELRDKILRLASHALEATVNDRKKGGTRAVACPAPTAVGMPASSSGGRRRS